MRRLRHLIAAPGFALAVSSALAQDCPSARDAKRGFVVERGDRQKSEIFHGDRGEVRSVMRYGGTTLLETNSLEGLFQLERIDRGRRTVIKPRTDLARLFPIKPGQRLSADFDYIDDGGRATPGAVV